MRNETSGVISTDPSPRRVEVDTAAAAGERESFRVATCCTTQPSPVRAAAQLGSVTHDYNITPLSRPYNIHIYILFRYFV